MSKPKLPALVAALDDATVAALLAASGAWEIQKLASAVEFEDKFDQLCSTPYQLVLCGDIFGADFMNEFAQVMRQQGTGLKIYSISTATADFQPAKFIKNGYTDAYRWPTDSPLLKEKIEEISRSVTGGQVFKTVFLTDLNSGTELPFDTYVHLPLNQKYVRFSGKGAPIGEKRIERLQTKEIGKMFIDKQNMNDFYSYAASSLLQQNKTGAMSETERQEKVTQNVRRLFSSVFDESQNSSFDTGKELLADAQKVVSQFLTNGKSSNWYSQMVMTLGGASNSYEHAGGVSAIATLIAIAINHPNPQDLAIAAFFHDVGRSNLPDEISHSPKTNFTKEEWDQYQLHPIETINILKKRKVILKPEVEKAILQHHERYDGKGFPKNLEGLRICLEAQILSFADQLTYLTLAKDGKARLSLKEAYTQIAGNGSIGPELLFKLKTLFQS